MFSRVRPFIMFAVLSVLANPAVSSIVHAQTPPPDPTSAGDLLAGSTYVLSLFPVLNFVLFAMGFILITGGLVAIVWRIVRRRG